MELSSAMGRPNIKKSEQSLIAGIVVYPALHPADTVLLINEGLFDDVEAHRGLKFLLQTLHEALHR